MSGLLKGNFSVRNEVIPIHKDSTGSTLEEQFEREATARLGGSICFVSKQRIQWEAADAKSVV